MRPRLLHTCRLLNTYSQKVVFTNSRALIPRLAPNSISQRLYHFTPQTENDEHHDSDRPAQNYEFLRSLDYESTQVESKEELLQRLDVYLHPLYHYFIETPLYEENDIRFIDLRPSSGASSTSWVDWVVIVSLKPDRERSLRAATTTVADIMETKISWPEGFKPTTISIEGLRSAEPVWGMIDAGTVAIHVMTAEARQQYSIEAAARDSVKNEDDMFPPS